MDQFDGDEPIKHVDGEGKEIPSEEEIDSSTDEKGKSPDDSKDEAGKEKPEESSSAKTDKPPSKDKPDTETKDNEDGALNGKKEFTKSLVELFESEAYADMSEPDRALLLSDLNNRNKLRASLTEKTKVLAKEREDYDSFVGKFSPEVRNNVITALKDEDFMEQLKDYFSDVDGGNPFKALKEAFEKVGERETVSTTERTEATTKGLAEERKLLVAMDSKFSDDTVFNTLVDETIQTVNDINAKEPIMSAYKLNHVLPAKIDEVTNLKAELKKANKEISDLKANPLRKSAPYANGEGVSKVIPANDDNSMETAIDNAKAAMGFEEDEV
jgi:hypothetical protein